MARLRVRGERIERVAVEAFVDALGLVCELIAARQRAGAQRRLLARARHDDTDDLIVSLIPDGRRSEVPTASGGPAARRDALRKELTARQREVFDLMMAGRTNGEIADHLLIALPTVKSHVRAVLRTLGAVNRADAVGRVALPSRPGGS